VHDDDWILEGIVFTYPVDQKVLIVGGASGKVMGPASASNCYIVALDQPLPGAKAIIVHEDDLRILSCNWCRDTKQVAQTPFTIDQYDTNTIPTRPCAECCKEEAIAWATKDSATKQ
jgi:hypothetical protein